MIEADDRRALVRVSAAVGVWGLCYAIYRGYYAAGGTAWLPGTIAPGWESRFRLINLVAAVILTIAAVLPIAALPLWSRRGARLVLLAVCWVVAVGCCMHALVDMVERVLSLVGLVDVHYPRPWATVDHRAADLQDLFGNEPWFLLEGLGYGAIAWIAMRAGRPARRWVSSALVAVAVLTLVGLLSVTGVIGKTIVA
ncbi:MAG TPA: hypothetical protein VF069_28420 [Streptosporangiaceae bacterium]